MKLSLVSLFGAAVALGLNAGAAAPEVEILPDVVYGHKAGMALTLDVIMPRTNANGSAVLFLVSGGFGVVQEAARKGVTH